MNIRLNISLLLIFFAINIAQAQYVEEKEKTKKELRQERKEQNKQEAEKRRKVALSALQDKDFTLRADIIFNKRNEIFNVVNTTNFILIKDDKIFVQYGDPINIGLNGQGGVTYEGNITKYEVTDRGEGKPIETRVFFSSPNTVKALSVYIQVTGEIAEARFISGADRLKMRGQFERTSESAIAVAQNLRNGM